VAAGRRARATSLRPASTAMSSIFRTARPKNNLQETATRPNKLSRKADPVQPPQRRGARLHLVRREILRLECNPTHRARRNRRLTRKSNSSGRGRPSKLAADHPGVPGSLFNLPGIKNWGRRAGRRPSPPNSPRPPADLPTPGPLLCRRDCAPYAVASRHGAKRDVEAVRAVDRHDSQGEVDELRFAELRPCQLINFIRHTAFGDAITASHQVSAARSRSL
jgi:hypothetical protein